MELRVSSSNTVASQHWRGKYSTFPQPINAQRRVPSPPHFMDIIAGHRHRKEKHRLVCLNWSAFLYPSAPSFPPTDRQLYRRLLRPAQARFPMLSEIVGASELLHARQTLGRLVRRVQAADMAPDVLLALEWTRALGTKEPPRAFVFHEEAFTGHGIVWRLRERRVRGYRPLRSPAVVGNARFLRWARRCRVRTLQQTVMLNERRNVGAIEGRQVGIDEVFVWVDSVRWRRSAEHGLVLYIWRSDCVQLTRALESLNN